jgi:hypothetical protein
MLEVVVRVSTGKEEVVRVPAWAYTDDLVMAIERRTGWRRDTQRLVHKRTRAVLEPGFPLAYYGLREGEGGEVVELEFATYCEEAPVGTHVAEMEPPDGARDVPTSLRKWRGGFVALHPWRR